jgi:hypothetical protein
MVDSYFLDLRVMKLEETLRAITKYMDRYSLLKPGNPCSVFP